MPAGGAVSAEIEHSLCSDPLNLLVSTSVGMWLF